MDEEGATDRRSRLPAEFWWLFAGALVSALATFVFPFLALFLTSRGLSMTKVGLVVALFGGGSIVSGPLAGTMADRFGRRPTLLVSLSAAAALTALLAFLESPVAVAVAVAGLGVAAPAFRPAASATIADVVAPAEQSRAFGLLYWGNNLGVAISLVVGGELASRGYVGLFLADAATTLLFALLVFWRVPETRPRSAPEASRAASGLGYAAVLTDRPFVVLLLLHFALLIPFCQFMAAAPVDMAAHGLGPQGFGRVLAVNGFLIALLQPFSARFTGRADPAHQLAAAALFVGLGYGGYGFCHDIWGFGLATAVWTLGEILALPVSSALVAELAPEDKRGRYQGLFSLTFGMGMAAAPALGGAFMSRFGADALWAACLGFGVVVALGHLTAAAPRRRALVARAVGRSIRQSE